MPALFVRRTLSVLNTCFPSGSLESENREGEGVLLDQLSLKSGALTSSGRSHFMSGERSSPRGLHYQRSPAGASTGLPQRDDLCWLFTTAPLGREDGCVCASPSSQAGGLLRVLPEDIRAFPATAAWYSLFLNQMLKNVFPSVTSFSLHA